MIVEIILNYERTSGGFDKVFLDTSKLEKYHPIGNNMPIDIVHIIENENYLSIMADGADSSTDFLSLVGMGHLGSQKDWFEEEYEQMLEKGVISIKRPSIIDKEFEISYC